MVGDLKWDGNSKSCLNERSQLNTNITGTTLAISESAASCMLE